MVLEKSGTQKKASLFFACFLVLDLKGCSITLKIFVRVHHVLLQITLMLQHLIFQEAPILLLLFFFPKH